jgi:isoleucyl-tRNA synthetase
MSNGALVDEELEAGMETLRRATNLGRSLRSKYQLKTRQPLRKITIITRRSADAAFITANKELVLGELNIKDIEFTTKEAEFVALGLKPNMKQLGPRLGKELGRVRGELGKISADQNAVADLLAKLDSAGKVDILGHELTEQDFLIDRSAKNADSLVASEGGVTVLLDTVLDEGLISEGLAREVVNRIQKLRKDSGLQVSDRIRLEIVTAGKLATAVESHKDYIARETLANGMLVIPGASKLPHKVSHDIDGVQLEIGLAVADA